MILSPVAQAVAAATDKWQPHVDMVGKFGSDRNIGKLDFFVPLVQDSDSLWFLDARGVFSDASTREGNLGLAYRRIQHGNGDDWIWGLYGFADVRRSEYGNTYQQATLGAELLTERYELRGNVYLPKHDSNVIASLSGGSTPGGTILSGTQVYTQVNGTTLVARERALPGFDVEAGYRFGLGDGQDLWAYAGYYRFDDSDTPTIAGPRLRLDYVVDEPFGWRGSQFTLGGEVQHDDVRGTESFASLQLRIPLGGHAGRSRNSGIERRMTSKIQRDVDIVTFAEDINKAAGSEGGPTSTTGATNTAVTDTTGGQVNVYFVQQGGTGDCTQANPCALADATADAEFAAGDAVVLLDAGGAISGTISLLDRQQLVGGGDSGSRTLTLGSTSATLDISSLGGRAQLDGGAGTAATLSNATLVSGFDISGGATGIGISAASDGATVSDLNISGTTTAIDAASGGSGTVTVQSDVAVSSGTGTGLLLSGGGTTVNFAGGITGGSGAAFAASGGSNTVAYTGSLVNNSGRLVNVTGGANDVTFSGTTSSVGGTGINIANSSGTITFSAASKTLSTGANAAVTLANNTGGTINFSNGGLAITTTSGAGFSATGGGTVNVSGTGNSITSTSGTALNVANTTIGASGLTFQSISANGATNGIVLNTTGSSGGLTVTGSGTTAGSGGTIQNTSGAGILLSSTQDVSLANVNVTGTGGAGLSATTVTNLDLDNLTVQNSSGINISLVDTKGTVNLLNSTVSNTTAVGGADGLYIDNSALASGTLTLTVDNSSFTGRGDTTGNGMDNAIDIVTGTGNTLNATITSNSFTGTYVDGIQLDVSGTAGGDTVTIGGTGTGNTFSGIGTHVMDLAALDNSSVTFDIRDNSANGNALSTGNGLDLFVGDNATATFNIVNNTLTGIGDATSDTTIKLVVGGTAAANSTVTATISNNSLTSNTATGLLVDNFGNSNATVTVTGNTFSGNGLNKGMEILTTISGTETCLSASGNTFGGSDQMYLTETADGSILRVPGSSDSVALGTANGGVTVNVSGGIGFSEPCTIP